MTVYNIESTDWITGNPKSIVKSVKSSYIKLIKKDFKLETCHQILKSHNDQLFHAHDHKNVWEVVDHVNTCSINCNNLFDRYIYPVKTDQIIKIHVGARIVGPLGYI